MNRTVKTILVWLLMLVLPLHAVAASVGMSCAPVGLHQAAPSEAAHHPGAADATLLRAGAHHGHGSAGHGPESADHEHAASPDPVKKPHSSCSACSVLCAGAVAPPSVIPPLPSFDGSDARIVQPAAFGAGFIPDGPQRPPRHPCA